MTTVTPVLLRYLSSKRGEYDIKLLEHSTSG